MKTLKKAYHVKNQHEALRLCRELARLLVRRGVYPSWHPADSWVERPDGVKENFINSIFKSEEVERLAKAYAYASYIADGGRPFPAAALSCYIDD